MANILTHIKSYVIRQYRQVVAITVGIIVGALLGFGALFITQEVTPVLPALEQEEVVATTSVLYARSAPVTISIPKIDIDTTFEAPLGLNDDMTIEVPETYTQVGWYKNGPTPGEVGPAVVLGHVDSYQGPAVFWPLSKLEAGDEIEIEREDKTKVVFVVDSVKRYSQDDFPTELVYGTTDTPQLRLITCTGIYDKGVQRYSHNIVVYASLKE